MIRGPALDSGSLANRTLYRLAAAVVLLMFCALGARLWYLQVLRGDHYYRRSTDNFIKEIPLPSARGLILDRKRRALADNRPRYQVYLTPGLVTAPALDRLAHFLHLGEAEAETLRAKVAAKKDRDRLHPMTLFEEIGHNEMALLEAHKAELPGITVDVEAHRFYPFGKVAAHVVGYMNQINAEEFPRLRDQGYRLSESIGRAGIERQWESYLHGKEGFERLFVDAKGALSAEVDRDELESFSQVYGGPRRVDPVAGDNVLLTIDLDLQRLVERAIGRHRSAAAAVVEVNTGRILALASHPAFDPNILTGRLTRTEDERLQKDPFRPLTDKALRENYYPGSTFKIVPALAALDDGLVSPEEKMICHGTYRLPGHTFGCMKSHGAMNLHRAMVESCNIYFYHLGERTGLDRMASLAADLGFGAPTGVALPGEAPGFIPTQEYYRRAGGFRSGYTLNTAIGQGSTKVTVLQLALAYAALANGGDLYVPLLVERIETPQGGVVQSFAPRLRHRIGTHPENLARVRSALCGVVNELKGTVYDFRDIALPVEVCGKSGTAQVTRTRKGEASGWDVRNDHAWFASFAPAKNPEIAVVVLVEHGGLGGHIAAPTSMEIYRGYFQGRR